MIIPGTTKLKPQDDATKADAITDPIIFPKDVWEFQIPMIKPRLENKIKI